ncbi:Tm-1-like ATP-binding domain-containing protein [Agromyces laixinhei]|uniref:Tm-1-like ATP-binding domain-containing protein n=1 Tax=Agromyces laixinhei TaxID=2585717 RepID=UPI0012EDE6DE|nr:Tm-1-like ATP-binding domain-containing protein [Agromyces laixinhei]
MNTIAVVASSDTKQAEIDFVSQQLTANGLRPLTIDTSTSKGHNSSSNISREAVVEAAGHHWADIEDESREFLLSAMADGASTLLAELQANGQLQGALGLGGLQNTTVAANAMQALPIGVPKIIVSTVACGTRTFDSVVGTSDIMVMPSITDLAGLNPISERILANSAAAVAGAVKAGGRPVEVAGLSLVGATLMGATNDGVVHAMDELRDSGYSVVPFHATGVGGQVLESLITAGSLSAVLDLTLHEIVYEYFGGGFGAGTDQRLIAAAEAGIPMVVAPGGLDFICQWRGELFADAEERKYIWHNENLAHVKLTEKEARDVTRIVVGRLNRAKGPVTVLLPTRGLRTFASVGGPLHDRVVDDAIIEEFQTGLSPRVRVATVEANLNDREFSRAAASELNRLLLSDRVVSA